MDDFFYLTALVLQTLIWPATRLILVFFGSFEVRGLEHLAEIRKKGIVFASNHSSELDPVLVPAALPFLSRFMPIFYTSRSRSFYEDSGFKQFFYGGILFKLWGAHPVFSGQKDYEKSLANHIKLLETGRSVLIFPEGGIPGRTGITGKARGGVAFLASHTGCPIVPIHIYGVERFRMSDFFLRKRKIGVIFGAPIFIGKELLAKDDMAKELNSPDSMNKADGDLIETYKEIAEDVMSKVRGL